MSPDTAKYSMRSKASWVENDCVHGYGNVYVLPKSSRWPFWVIWKMEVGKRFKMREKKLESERESENKYLKN